MADALFELTSGSSAWASDQAFDLSARAVFVNNLGAYPVRLRWNGSTGSAVAKIPAGSSRLFRFPRSAVKTDIALYGVGGASAVDVEVSTDEMDTSIGGASGNLVLADLSSSTPAALGTAAAGSASTAARGDHVHASPVGSTVALAPAASASAGVSAEVSRVDHVHPHNLSSSTPANLGTAAAGSATTGARSDHVHQHPGGSTVALAPGTASAGVSTEVSRVDHVHPMGTCSPSLAAQSSNKRRLTITGLGSNVTDLELLTAAGAIADGSQQALALVTGTSAAWSMGSGSCVRALITPDTGSVVVDVDRKSSGLVGSVYVVGRVPATGASFIVEAAFT